MSGSFEKEKEKEKEVFLNSPFYSHSDRRVEKND
jgi:hypothetical protein